MIEEKVYLIDGHEVVLNDPVAYERTLKEINANLRPNKDGEIIPFITRIFDRDQVVVEKARNPNYRTGQYYFAVKTIDGVRPPKHP